MDGCARCLLPAKVPGAEVVGGGVLLGRNVKRSLDRLGLKEDELRITRPAEPPSERPGKRCPAAEPLACACCEKGR